MRSLKARAGLSSSEAAKGRSLPEYAHRGAAHNVSQLPAKMGQVVTPEHHRVPVELVPPDLFDTDVYPDDVDALHAELEGRAATIIQPRIDQPYGLREFRVQDPDG